MRAEDSPERRGVVDATDFTAKSLDGRFPPLEPLSSPESVNSDQRSPAGSSFKITPSLLSADGSDSTGLIETGLAKLITITPVKIVPEVDSTNYGEDVNDNLTRRSSINTSLSKYILNAPGSSKSQRHGPLLKNNHENNGSPSRLPRRSSGIKLNRSFLRGRQAMSVRGRQSLALIDASRGAQASLGQGDVRIDLPLTIPTFANSTQLSSTVNQSEKSPPGDIIRGSERSSKYGYNIRESFEARDVIMGESGPSKVHHRHGGNEDSLRTRTFLSRNGQVRELKLEFATPPPEKQLKKLEKDINADYAHLSSSDEKEDVAETENYEESVEYLPKENCRTASKIGHPVSLMKPPTRTPPHPPRTSSLPVTPSPPGASTSFKNKIGPGPHTRRPPVPKAQIYGVPASNAAEEAPQASRISLFYRQTTASASRASSIGKKMTDPRSSTSRLPQSRTLGSLGDVSKGMKKFGKKVGKIIPGRRSVTVETVAEEALATTAENRFSPTRQPSRLLTTYHNSGMEKASADDLDHSATISGSFIETEPKDKHEVKEAKEDRAAWRNASENLVRDSTGRLTFFAPGDPQRGNGENDDEPPRAPRGQLDQGGHYVESAGGESSNGNAEDASNSDSNTGDNHDDGARPLLSPEDTTVEDGGADFPISNTHFDQMLSETDIQARELMDYAQTLADSPLRTLIVETATRLGEGLIRVRQARMQAIRMSQAIDEITVIMTANTARMAVILRNMPVRT